MVEIRMTQHQQVTQMQLGNAWTAVRLSPLGGEVSTGASPSAVRGVWHHAPHRGSGHILDLQLKELEKKAKTGRSGCPPPRDPFSPDTSHTTFT